MSAFGRWMANRYGGRAGLYEAIAARMEKAGVEKIRARLAGAMRGRIIEVGCGTGLNFAHYEASAEVVAIEPIHDFRNLAAERAAAAAARIEVIEGDAQALDFPDASFDAAFVTLVFCSVPDADRGLAELRRVVRPGGRVVLFEHVRSERPLVRAVQEILNPAWWRFMDGCNLNRDTASRIRGAGFQVEETRTFALPGAAGMLFPMVEVVARA
jgi:ubiquinone/menaquinone biosynthesis C-methylase UbiE